MNPIKTPLADFLKKYAASDTVRLHMPGHKGRLQGALAEAAAYDITEVKGADSLFEADGVIRESEETAAELYGSGLTCYSAGGSTLCIQAMLALACPPESRVIAARNAHRAFMSACVLLDLSPYWVLPRYNDRFGVSGEVDAGAVREALEACPQARAVYLTSPDYLGCMSDIAAIGRVCREKGVPLLVDNAHGAHLRFLPEDLHPMTLGAAMCSDSAHKTLPVLTGGAYLHVSREYAAGVSREEVKEKMGLFGSTSPSYLILLSLDLCNAYLAGEARGDFAKLAEAAAELYQKPFSPISARYDPTKVTLDAYAAGFSGEELADLLRRRGIECEYAAKRHVVLMLSPKNTAEELARLREALILPEREPLPPEEGRFSLPEQAMRPREAAFAGRELVAAEEALGRTAAETRIQCPPGVPLVIAGEKIGEDTQKILKTCGIPALYVIK